MNVGNEFGMMSNHLSILFLDPSAYLQNIRVFVKSVGVFLCLFFLFIVDFCGVFNCFWVQFFKQNIPIFVKSLGFFFSSFYR